MKINSIKQENNKTTVRLSGNASGVNWEMVIHSRGVLLTTDITREVLTLPGVKVLLNKPKCRLYPKTPAAH